MGRTGPVTKKPSAIALGLAQIRVGASLANIAVANPVLVAADSIGSLATTKFTGTVEYWRHKSGFPALEDIVYPLSETAMMECQFEEITPYNLALAKGMDPSLLVDASTGSIGLGTITAPKKIRMEAWYTYPQGQKMTIIFPAAQVTSSVELDLQAEDNAKSPISFEAKRADSEAEGGHTVWDSQPLGVIVNED